MMCKYFSLTAVFVVSLFLCGQWAVGQAQQANDFQITPGQLNLPSNNRRTAEPSEPRVYPAKKDGTPDRSQGPVWIGSPSNSSYTLQNGQATAYHNALDISSRNANGAVAPLEFNAGVYGRVVASRPGFIAVRLPDGNFIQYLHVSQGLAKPGQDVTPRTPLGVTGNRGTNGKPIQGMTIHLHIQATDSKGRVLNPDRAFQLGRNEPRDRTLTTVVPEWIDVGPLLIDGRRPKAPDGVVNYNDSVGLYFDENAPKGKVAMSGAPEDRLLGTWYGVFDYTFRKDGKVISNGSVIAEWKNYEDDTFETDLFSAKTNKWSIVEIKGKGPALISHQKYIQMYRNKDSNDLRKSRR
jgi:hypothetical protein